MVYLAKNQTTYCKFCKGQFLLKWNTLKLNCTFNDMKEPVSVYWKIARSL